MRSRDSPITCSNGVNFTTNYHAKRMSMIIDTVKPLNTALPIFRRVKSKRQLFQQAT